MANGVTNGVTWEYRMITAEAADSYERALNAAGAQGWEAVSSGYAVGESKKVSLGQGMPLSTAIGASQWSALMKRPIPR